MTTQPRNPQSVWNTINAIGLLACIGMLIGVGRYAQTVSTNAEDIKTLTSELQSTKDALAEVKANITDPMKNVAKMISSGEIVAHSISLQSRDQEKTERIRLEANNLAEIRMIGPTIFQLAHQGEGTATSGIRFGMSETGKPYMDFRNTKGEVEVALPRGHDNRNNEAPKIVISRNGSSAVSIGVTDALANHLVIFEPKATTETDTTRNTEARTVELYITKDGTFVSRKPD